MLSLTTRNQTMDPAAEVVNRVRRLGELFDGAFAGWPFDGDGSMASSWVPACDVFEEADALKIVLEVPGVRPEEVKISLENDTLTVRGEKKQEAEERTERVHRYERTYGTFERRFALPGTVDADRIEAGYAHGLLTIRLPKAERARPRLIPVKAS